MDEQSVAALAAVSLIARASLFVTALCGAYTVLFGLVLCLLLNRGIAQRLTQVLSAVIIGLFISTCVYWASAISTFDSSLKSAFDTAGVTDPDVPTIESCTPTVCLNTSVLLSDGVVWWRAWAIWGRKPSVMVLGLTFILATCTLGTMNAMDACDMKQIAVSSRTRAEGTLFVGDAYGVAAAALSLATNVSATFLVGLKAWQHRRLIKENLNRLSGRTRVEEVLLLLVESALVYCLLWCLLMTAEVGLAVDPNFFTVDAHSSAAKKAFVTAMLEYIHPALVPIIGLYPTTVILLVSRQQSRFAAHLTSPRGADGPLPVAIPLRHVTQGTLVSHGAATQELGRVYHHADQSSTEAATRPGMESRSTTSLVCPWLGDGSVVTRIVPDIDGKPNQHAILPVVHYVAYIQL
ncbi:hypothetical protein C8Q78DRAFT_1083611 [Trametes maxima]|nr:hypothetical protein C8Q78DRAFT_1083611 [Trametes maxima]